ncbi:unnamed protein product [Ascophyllum nodosum]
MSMPYSPGAPLATVKSSGGYHSAMKTRNGTMPKEKRDTSEVSPRKRKSRRVRFNTVVKLFLVPARSDLGSLVLDLWWQREDYLMFRINKLEAIMDSSAKHSPTLFEPHPVKVHHAESRRHRRSYPHPVEIAHALEAVYCSGPVGLSSAPLSPLAVKRRAASRRALPPTPPTSPTRASTAGLFQEDGA